MQEDTDKQDRQYQVPERASRRRVPQAAPLKFLSIRNAVMEPKSIPVTMAADVKIRRFRIEDYDALIALWDKAHLPYRPKGRDRRDKIEKEIKHSNTVFLVAEADGSPCEQGSPSPKAEGRLVGSVFGTHDGRKGWINRVAVSPDCRKQGIGARLVKEVEKHLEDLGIGITACLIEDRNTVSRAVFERLGYMRHTDIAYFSKRKHPET